MILLIYPSILKAYSKYIYAGGESVGIELKSNLVLIVGRYNVNELKTNLKVGDKIIKVDDKQVKSIKEFSDSIQKKDKVKVTYIRNNKILEETIKVKYDDGIYKTGLYVKDDIMGIGTLTYIDPLTNIFGCLGHEIVEKTTKQIFDVNDGSIFFSNISKIVKSKPGNAGEKVAKFDSSIIYGNIFENTKYGIFGKYTAETNNKELYKVASYDEIQTGAAKILTTIKGNQVEAFEIKIIKITSKNDNHDILFEITDKSLLSRTNGIVQGMSGSPIIQNDKIIGAVTHVIVDNPVRGYGIYIGKMLTEGEN